MTARSACLENFRTAYLDAGDKAAVGPPAVLPRRAAPLLLPVLLLQLEHLLRVVRRVAVLVVVAASVVVAAEPRAPSP
jgi:hypothetical protein